MRRSLMPYFCAALVAALLAACGDTPSVGGDAGDALVLDAADSDVAVDTGEDAQADARADVTEPDTGEADTGEADTDDASEADADEDVRVSCADDQCEIDGECFDSGTVNPDNPCELCLVVVSAEAWSYQDDIPCDDDDLCTQEDTCFEGTCMGTVATCDDGNPCTDDMCDPETGECSTLPIPENGACFNGDPCSLNDTCNEGECVAGGDTLHCASDNPCMAARCEPGVGCVTEPLDGIACDDGNACTTGGMCQDGECVVDEEPLDCDDGNLCTLNWCDPESGCMERSIADLCTDDNPCTDEACDPELGCVYPFNTDPCDDGLTCTTGDVCIEGACRGLPVVPDDGNVCTDDVCVEPLGVMNTPNEDVCDDNNACTVGDVCSEGGCIPGTEPLDCDDGNVCTDQTCNPASGCEYVNNMAACDDGDMCTVDDVCGDGSCTPGPPLDCDDGNACTIDSCGATTGCVNTLIVSNACRPTILVDFPPRAATVEDDGSGTITVRGTVVSGAGSIDVFTINGVATPVGAEGAFSLEVAPNNGGNFLVIEAEDAMGSPRKVVQSYAFSQSYVLPDLVAGTGHSEEGLGLYVSDAAFASVSSVLVTLFENLDLAALLPENPLIDESPWITVNVREDLAEPVTFGTPTVVLDSTPAGVKLNIRLPSLVVYLRNTGILCSGDQTLTATSINMEATLALSVVDHALSAALNDVDVKVSGMGASCTSLNLAASFVAGELETKLEEALRDSLGATLGDSLADLVLAFDLDFPSIDPEGADITISLSSDFNAVTSDDDGLNMKLRTIVTSENNVPYVNLGIPERNGCGTPPQELAFYEEDEFEVLLADDTVSQILWGAWHGGLLEFDVPESLLGDLDLSAYGITNLELSASGMLQPIASDCGSDGLVAHIGDLRINANMSLLGTPLEVVLYLSLAAKFEVGAAAGEISFAISDIERVELQVEVTDEAFIAVESTFEDLILDNLVPALLDALGGDSLGSFALPEIDLSGVIEGATGSVEIVPSQVRRNEGNTVVGGSLEVNP